MHTGQTRRAQACGTIIYDATCMAVVVFFVCLCVGVHVEMTGSLNTTNPYACMTNVNSLSPTYSSSSFPLELQHYTFNFTFISTACSDFTFTDTHTAQQHQLQLQQLEHSRLSLYQANAPPQPATPPPPCCQHKFKDHISLQL